MRLFLIVLVFLFWILFFFFFFFFFNDTATTEIYTLSLHDALPNLGQNCGHCCYHTSRSIRTPRSEEHTSELQSQSNLVCRLLLEKKKKKKEENLVIQKIKQKNNKQLNNLSQ